MANEDDIGGLIDIKPHHYTLEQEVKKRLREIAERQAKEKAAKDKEPKQLDLFDK